MHKGLRIIAGKLFHVSLLAGMIMLCSIKASAQVEVSEELAPEDQQTVVLYADPRLAMITSFREPVKVNSGTGTNSAGVSGSIRSGRGFRIIIYSGIDRAKANSTKADFMRRHPGTRVYMTYALPQYRIKVGDYTSRAEANEFYRKLSSTYSPCMIVPDIVEINTFRKND